MENNNEMIYLRISILVTIKTFNDNEQIDICLLDRNRTIKQLLDLTEKSNNKSTRGRSSYGH